jgi:hypothetical protein
MVYQNIRAIRLIPLINLQLSAKILAKTIQWILLMKMLTKCENIRAVQPTLEVKVKWTAKILKLSFKSILRTSI